MYYAMFVIGFAAALFVNLITYYKYNTTRLRVAFYSITVFYGFLCAMLAGVVYTKIYQSFGYHKASKLAMFGAVMLTPVLEIITIYIEKMIRRTKNRKHPDAQLPDVSIRNTLDMLTPDIFIILACGKLGCHFAGCCYGVACSWGIHTPYVEGIRVFPVQIAEATLTFIIIIICYFLKQKQFFRSGMAYPLTAGMYSAVRFVMEHYRWYEPEMRRLILGMTLWQFCAIIVFTCSFISVIILYKTQPSAPLPAAKTLEYHLTSEREG